MGNDTISLGEKMYEIRWSVVYCLLLCIQTFVPCTTMEN